MPEFIYDPPISPTPGLIQTIRMNEGQASIGTAIWQSASASDDGVAQILDFNITAALCRQGNGKRLLAGLVAQMLAYHRSRDIPARRLWILLRQKRHVIARAFFASQGFTHIATVKEVLRDEDGLIYVRTFD